MIVVFLTKPTPLVSPSFHELENRLRELSRQQQQLATEIQHLRQVIADLKNEKQPEVIDTKLSVVAPHPNVPAANQPVAERTAAPTARPPRPAPREKGAWEDFIGTNLLNKIGIAVLVIGISFGVKYAIDHEMLNPLTRIILGYLAGAIILVLALKLKKDYHAFSAVLLSGGMATLYFITFAAYDFYHFLPQAVAFAIMVGFTAFTVFAAMQYNLQVIGIIGLIGAYAVPFLLSDGSGRVAVLFSYIAITNMGILVISFQRTWRVLFGLAFALTWIIFGSWMVGGYDQTEHLWLSLGFATLFFLLFYIAFLVGKLLNRVTLKVADVALVLINCFIYYGSGYAIVNEYPGGESYLGIFTVFNAVVHFAVGVFVYTRLRESKDTFYFVAGLVLAFLTLAVPVQLEGNWVTLIWALEACVLFWVGRQKKFTTYELLSYPLLGLSFLSLLHDWQALSFRYVVGYGGEDIAQVPLTPVLNIYFLTSLLVAGAFAFFFWSGNRTPVPTGPKLLTAVLPVIHYLVPATAVLVLYVTFYQEVALHFSNLFQASAIRDPNGGMTYNPDWTSFRTVWLLNYSILFFGVLVYLAHRFWVATPLLNRIVFGILAFIVLLFLSAGLHALEALRFSYLAPADRFYSSSFWNVAIRYVCYVFVAGGLLVNYWLAMRESNGPGFRQWERLFCHFTILTLLSSELLSLLALNGNPNGFKLALSILWGSYALYLIIWGFAKNQSYLRIAGIALFGITLLKLFFYDMSEMGTIAKTIVLMIMGILLLLASFIYNKRKRAARDTTHENQNGL